MSNFAVSRTGNPPILGSAQLSGVGTTFWCLFVGDRVAYGLAQVEADMACDKGVQLKVIDLRSFRYSDELRDNVLLKVEEVLAADAKPTGSVQIDVYEPISVWP